MSNECFQSQKFPARNVAMTEPLLDKISRPLRDLRISVTDRCNFRCRYCMPREVFDADFEFLQRQRLLTFEEINRVVKSLLPLGIKKVRITGGEPLLRRDLANLVAMLSDHDLDLALTTNASLLAKYAKVLSKAGLNRVTVSLDAMDEATFQEMNDVELSIQQVLDGIEVAHSSGLDLKINCVIQRGVNEHAILPLVEYFRHTPHVLRFIEYMDVGNTNAWSLDEVVSVEEIIAKISAVYPLNPIPRTHVGDTASRYSFADGGGEIGVISSVSAPFCSNCNRARISADGQIYTCLFASSGFDLRERLRRGDSDDELAKFVSNIWRGRDDQYSQLRSNNIQTRDKIEMSYIGG